MTNHDSPLFSGAITALITPFKNGKLDEKCFQDLLERQINLGINGVVPVGTTGESATLNDKEHWRVFELAVEVASGRVPVIAGCGSNDTVAAIEHTEMAKKLGADGALHVAPYYNKPNQKGIIAHFNAICNAVDLPIVVYNIPGRTGIDILPSTLGEIAKHKNIVALKDSAGDPSRTVLNYAACKEGFAVLSGDDNHNLGFAAYGAKGAISVLSNIMPKEAAQLQSLVKKGDFAAARALNAKIDVLQRAIFTEPGLVCTKWVMAEMGLCSPEVRLPLVEISDESKKIVKDAMIKAGL